MSFDRKTLAKYGAKIPVARSTGAKQTHQGKQEGPADAPAKAGRSVKKSDDKKR